MTDAEMKIRYERQDPSILVNGEIGPRDHGRLSLRLVARARKDRVSVSLEHWHQPDGARVPVVCEALHHFAERELDRLIWALREARDEIRNQGRPTCDDPERGR